MNIPPFQSLGSVRFKKQEKIKQILFNNDTKVTLKKRNVKKNTHKKIMVSTKI